MLGHNDISQNCEIVSSPCLFENAKKEVASSGRSQMRLPPITTECDEVNRSFEIIALEPCGHTVRLCGCVMGGL